jgi:hypothetical protein
MTRPNEWMTSVSSNTQLDYAWFLCLPCTRNTSAEHSNRGKTVRFAYVTSLRVEGKQMHYRYWKWDGHVQSTASGK